MNSVPSESNCYDVEFVKNAKGLKLVHLNVRSLLANIDEVRVNLLDGSFDIVTLSETWLHSQCSDSLLQTEGYTLYRHDRQTKTPGGKVKRGGGIAVYIKDEMNVTVWPLLSVSNSDLELLSISAKLGHNRHINLFSVYRPPTGRLQPALDVLNDNITELRKTMSGEIVVLGDFNIDLISNTRQSRGLTGLANALGISQLIRDPTRVTNNSRTLIDHLY